MMRFPTKTDRSGRSAFEADRVRVCGRASHYLGSRWAQAPIPVRREADT